MEKYRLRMQGPEIVGEITLEDLRKITGLAARQGIPAGQAVFTSAALAETGAADVVLTVLPVDRMVQESG